MPSAISGQIARGLIRRKRFGRSPVGLSEDSKRAGKGLGLSRVGSMGEEASPRHGGEQGSFVSAGGLAHWTCPALMDGLGVRQACLGDHVSFRIRWAKDSPGPSGGVRDCKILR